MALVIIPAGTPLTVETIVMVLYGQPGTGKTTAALGASRPLLLDCDNVGLKRVVTRGRPDRVNVTHWLDVASMTEADVAAFDTVIVDTVGGLQNYLIAHITATDKKKATRSGGLTKAGYGDLKVKLMTWVNTMLTFGKDVIIIAHGSEVSHGEDTVMRIKVVGGAKDDIYGLADVMGCMRIDGNEKVTLDCSPRYGQYGKNPGQWGPIIVPPDDNTMARLIADAKAKMENAGGQGAAPVAPAEEPKATGPLVRFNARFRYLRDVNAPAADKLTLLEEAADAGLEWSEDVAEFVISG